MRLWNTELSLETTLMFFKSPQVYGNDLNGELISKLAWSPSGLCVAASMEGTLNIYTIQRRWCFYFSQSNKNIDIIRFYDDNI